MDRMPVFEVYYWFMVYDHVFLVIILWYMYLNMLYFNIDLSGISGGTHTPKKKILLLKGKEKEIPFVRLCFLQSARLASPLDHVQQLYIVLCRVFGCFCPS